MSQHYFRTEQDGQLVDVLLGYDGPMGHVFMVVTRNGGTHDAVTLYNNMEEADAFDKDLSYFKAKLAALRIVVPQSMFEEVTIDQRMRAGNRRVRHEPDGTFTAL